MIISVNRKEQVMRITAELLRAEEACHVEVFEAQWPDGCDVTLENCEIAFGELGMDVDWAASALLSSSACEEYLAATLSAWAEQRNARFRPLARAKYNKIAAITFCELAQQST